MDKGSTIIVTGGASGLGAGTVRMVVEGGGNALIADLKEAEGQALAAELGKTARFVKTDVADEASARGAVAAALSTFGGLQGLVGCAGIVHGEKVVGKDAPHALEAFARTISINLVGMFNVIRLAADAMSKGAPNAEGERGVIVNTASVAAFDGQIGQAAYAASKGGIVAHDAADRTRARAIRYSRHDDCARHLPHADDGKPSRPKCRRRWARRCRSRRDWERRRNSHRSSPRSSATRCSTAR